MKSLLVRPVEASEPLFDTAEGGSPGELRIRAADCAGARSSANVLLERMYASRGYKAARLPDLDDPNHLSLVATDHGAVVGTLTIGWDSEDGLLADELFQDEVDALRQAGRQVCEFTKLAMDGVAHSQRVLASMFHVAFIVAHRIKGCDNLLIEVNPRHTRFYEAKLGFRALGPARMNRRVDAPAVLMTLDLWYAQEQVSRRTGNLESALSDRSLYTYAFSEREEAAIAARVARHTKAPAAAALSL